MQMTRPGTLAGIFVVCAIVAWLSVRATFTNLPLLPITAVPALGALAIAEAAVGRHIRNRLTGRKGSATKPVAPIAVARLVALDGSGGHRADRRRLVPGALLPGATAARRLRRRVRAATG